MWFLVFFLISVTAYAGDDELYAQREVVVEQNHGDEIRIIYTATKSKNRCSGSKTKMGEPGFLHLTNMIFDLKLRVQDFHGERSRRLLGYLKNAYEASDLVSSVPHLSTSPDDLISQWIYEDYQIVYKLWVDVVENDSCW